METTENTNAVKRSRASYLHPYFGLFWTLVKAMEPHLLPTRPRLKKAEPPMASAEVPQEFRVNEKVWGEPLRSPQNFCVGVGKVTLPHLTTNNL